MDYIVDAIQRSVNRRFISYIPDDELYLGNISNTAPRGPIASSRLARKNDQPLRLVLLLVSLGIKVLANEPVPPVIRIDELVSMCINISYNLLF